MTNIIERVKQTDRPYIFGRQGKYAVFHITKMEREKDGKKNIGVQGN